MAAPESDAVSRLAGVLSTGDPRSEDLYDVVDAARDLLGAASGRQLSARFSADANTVVAGMARAARRDGGADALAAFILDLVTTIVSSMNSDESEELARGRRRVLRLLVHGVDVLCTQLPAIAPSFRSERVRDGVREALGVAMADPTLPSDPEVQARPSASCVMSLCRVFGIAGPSLRGSAWLRLALTSEARCDDPDAIALLSILRARAMGPEGGQEGESDHTLLPLDDTRAFLRRLMTAHQWRYLLPAARMLLCAQPGEFHALMEEARGRITSQTGVSRTLQMSAIAAIDAAIDVGPTAHPVAVGEAETDLLRDPGVAQQPDEALTRDAPRSVMAAAGASIDAAVFGSGAERARARALRNARAAAARKAYNAANAAGDEASESAVSRDGAAGVSGVADDPDVSGSGVLYDGVSRTPVWRPAGADLGVRISAAAVTQAVMSSKQVQDDRAMGAAAGGDAVPTHQSNRRPARDPAPAANEPPRRRNRQPSTSYTLHRLARSVRLATPHSSGVETEPSTDVDVDVGFEALPLVGVRDEEDLQPHIALSMEVQRAMRTERGDTPPEPTFGGKPRTRSLISDAGGVDLQRQCLRRAVDHCASRGDFTRALHLAGIDLSLQQNAVRWMARLGEVRGARIAARTLGLDLPGVPKHDEFTGEGIAWREAAAWRARDMAQGGGRFWGVPVRLVGGDPAAGPGSVEDAPTADAANSPRGKLVCALLDTTTPVPVVSVDSPAALTAMCDAILGRPGGSQAEGAGGEAAAHPAGAGGAAAAAVTGPPDTLLGVDAEWRPSRRYDSVMPDSAAGLDTPDAHVMKHLSWPVSTLQIATRSRAWIVDMLQLYANASGAAAHDAVAGQFLRLFGSPRIAKLGFGLDGDLARLAASYPEWSSGLGQARAVVDVRRVLEDLAAAEVSAEPVQSAAVAGSLSAVVERLLGYPMRKHQQTSDWQRRPLSAAQLKYGALDALALVGLIDGAALALAEGNARVSRVEAEEFVAEALSRVCADVETPADAIQKCAPTFSRAPPEGETERARAIRLEWLRVLYTPVCASAVPTPERPATAATRPVAPTDTGAAGVDGSLVSLPATGMLGPSDVRVALAAAGLPASRMMASPTTGATAMMAAATLGVPVRAVIKSLAFLCDGKPVIALVPGATRVDYARLARALKSSRRKLRFATPAVCAEMFGYTPGSFPPLGLRCDPQVVMEAAILTHCASRSSVVDGGKWIFAGGGSETMHIFLRPEELRVSTGAVVAEIIREDESEELRAAVPAVPAVSAAEPLTERGAASAAGGSSGTVAPPAGPAPAGDGVLASGPEESEDKVIRRLFTRPKFSLDTGLGRLTRWLRVVGNDATVIKEMGHHTFAGVVADADASGRIIVTRNHRLVVRKESGPTFLVAGSDTGEYFEDLTEHFALTCSSDDLMSRCAKCGGMGYYLLSREDLLARSHLLQMPHPKVLNFLTEFYVCRTCHRVFWAGPSFHNTRERFLGILEELDSSGTHTRNGGAGGDEQGQENTTGGRDGDFDGEDLDGDDVDDDDDDE